MKKKYETWQNTENVLLAFTESSSIKEILIHLNLPLNTTNYRHARNWAAEHKISLPRLSGAEQTKNMNYANEKFVPLSQEIFKENSIFSRKTVKNRLLKEGILEYRCYGPICENSGQKALTEWAGITLQLEHKNGVGDDNRIENLELLCPNCHSMTDTFGNGNRTRYENGTHGFCKNCGRPSKTILCPMCVPVKKTLAGGALETIANDISERGIEKVSIDYNMEPKAFIKALRKRYKKIIRIIEKIQKPNKICNF